MDAYCRVKLFMFVVLTMYMQGIEAVPGQTLAGEEDSLLSQQDQGDSLLEQPSQSTPNGDLLGGGL